MNLSTSLGPEVITMFPLHSSGTYFENPSLLFNNWNILYVVPDEKMKLHLDYLNTFGL